MSSAADELKRGGSLGRAISLFLGWAIATLLVLTPVTSIIFLGWLMRHMRMVAFRCAGFECERPGLITGQGRWHGRLLGGLAANIREGLLAALSLALATAPFTIIWLLSWWAGWENSFSKGYEQAFVGPLLGLAGAAIFSAVMIWLPMAQAHQAVENRALALFEVRAVRSVVRHSGWGYLFWACATVIAAMPLFAGRGLVVFASDIVPGIEEMGPDQIEAIRLGLLLVQAAYVILALWVLRGWSARIYAHAVSRALASPDSKFWQESVLSGGLHGGRRSWQLIHWVRVVLLAVIWVGLSFQIFVGQFLNHAWHLWLTHPFLVLPWIG